MNFDPTLRIYISPYFFDIQCQDYVPWHQGKDQRSPLVRNDQLLNRQELGDLPFVGRLFRGRGRNSKKKNMVIYVKPTIIDPAGNKKNNPAQMPFARTQAPDSMGFVPPQDPAAIGGGGEGPINKIQGGRILAQPRR